MRRIIVGLDGTQKDQDLIEWIADFAEESAVQIIAAHYVPRASLWMVAGAQLDTTTYLAELREHLETELTSLRSRGHSVHLHVQAGDPAHELAALARQSEADLIVIGAPGHSIVHDVVFGNVNVEHRLTRDAGVPVLTVPCGSRHLDVVHATPALSG
jgi:nucleotide-binding universal stress UspA family protein